MSRDCILETQDLSRSFGALMAVDTVNLEFERGQIHAVIGPNGAGKSTLINLLSGELAPSRGRIRFNGVDITASPPYRISQIGIGRSYQKTNIFPQFTCLQNCWLASQSRLPSSLRFFRPARRLRAVEQGALAALQRCGLEAQGDTVAATMSYGAQRQLEIAMMLATEPQLLLLDEPLAGMGAQEAAQVIDLLRELAQHHSLVLIEHDMDAVFAIADTITVMVNGRVLETGSPDQIRASVAVREAYLGDEEPA